MQRKRAHQQSKNAQTVSINRRNRLNGSVEGVSGCRGQYEEVM